MTEQARRLYRSRTNKVIAGVCGGIGEYLNADPALIRVAFLALTIFGGSGILLYIIAYFIMPEGPVAAEVASSSRPSTGAAVIGGVLIVVGGLILLDNLDVVSFHELRHLCWDFLFPALLILAGVYAVTRGRTAPAPAPDSAAAGEPPPAEQAPSSPGSPPGPKTLTRSLRNRKLLGICGGLGEYFEIDPTIIRLLYIAFTIITGGGGVIIYFIMFFVIPEERVVTSAERN